MKKILALTVMIISISGSAFAATLSTNGVSAAGVGIYGGRTQSGTGDGADTATSPLGKLSSGVSCVVNFDSTNGTSYALATKHVKGSKISATAADSTNMYFKASPQGLITATEVGDKSANDNFASGWTSM
jgi:hypothetical protein